jgi:alcohol dehydrogenase YqhD (iron-dependent ADH family)
MQFEWIMPTRVVFGAGRFASTHKYVRGLGKRVFLMTSRSYARGEKLAPVLDELLAQLKRIGVEWEIFSEVEPNPRVATIDRAAARAREFRPRYVLALGGGSVMDAAKCVALLCVNEGGIYQYSYRGPGRPMAPFNHALPVVCIPTVAATSSETDFYAVVTNKEEKRKTTVFGEALRPAVSIIDPELTYTVPARQTVDGAFDIITHVTESYLSTPVPAPVQDGITEAIVGAVIGALPRALANPRDADARAQLSWCASLALSGVLAGRAGGWPIHALEHGLNAYIDQAHGRGLALVLPRIMDFDAAVPAGAEKIARYRKTLFDKAFMKDVGAWSTLAELLPAGASLDEVIAGAAEHALEIKGIWKTGEEPYLDNIRPLYREDAIAVLRACAS